MDNKPLTIGAIIKSLRESRGNMSIQALHRVSTVSASHISRIEKNEVPPSSKIIKKLAPHLGVETNTLLKAAGLLEDDTKSDGPVELKQLLLLNEVQHQGQILNRSNKEGLVKIVDTVVINFGNNKPV